MTDAIDSIAAIKRARAVVAAADGVELRPAVVDDVSEAYVSGMQDPAVTEHLGSVRETRQDHATVEAYVAANEADPRDLLLGVIVDGVLRGTVRLHDVDEERGAATVGIALFDRTVWGRGVARTALRLLTRVARDLGLRTLEAGILPGNVGSQRAFAAAGFALAEAQDGRELWAQDLGGST